PRSSLLSVCVYVSLCHSFLLSFPTRRSSDLCALLLLLAYRALFCGDVSLNRFELVTLIRVGGKGAQQYASAKNAGVDDGPDCKPARFHGPCHGINRLSPHGEGLFHDEQRLTSHLLRDFHTHQRQHGRREDRKSVG